MHEKLCHRWEFAGAGPSPKVLARHWEANSAKQQCPCNNAIRRRSQAAESTHPKCDGIDHSAKIMPRVSI